MITLREITKENFRECVRLSVYENQQAFVASNVYSLAEAWLYRDVAEPFAIYNGNEMVGFLMLAIDSKHDGHRNDCDIWRFMIDKNHQNKGYGRAAMTAALGYIRQFPEIERVRLSYEPENTVAEKLYASFGFKPTGEIDGDEIVMEMTLQ